MLEELEPAPLEDIERPIGLERPESLLGDETVEPMAGMVGQETDDAEPLAEEFRVETSEEIVLRSSGGGEFQVPDASQELFSRAPGLLRLRRSAATGSRSSGGGAGRRAEPEPEAEPAVAGGDDSSLLDFGPVLVEAVGMVPPRDEEDEPEASAASEEAATEVAEPPHAVEASEPEPPAVVAAEPVAKEPELAPD